MPVFAAAFGKAQALSCMSPVTGSGPDSGIAPAIPDSARSGFVFRFCIQALRMLKCARAVKTAYQQIPLMFLFRAPLFRMLLSGAPHAILKSQASHV